MKKKVTKVFKFMIVILLFLFVTLYISDKNGYFAYSNFRRNILTEEGIKQFEEDVASGKAIDIENYIEKDVDYSNNISRTSLHISNKIGGYIRSGIVSFFDRVTSNIE